jgi:hypothetical protein
MVIHTPMADSAEAAATAQKVARQPNCCAMKVPAGTPTTVATVRPPTITAIALPRCCFATDCIAMTPATAQNPAYTNALTTRDASSSG